MGKAPVTEAFCAVGPKGKIDIDMIRRNAASCHSAAQNIEGKAWPALGREGWRVVRVRVVAIGEEEPEAIDMPEPRWPPPRGASALPPGPALRTIAAPVKAALGLLRCGARPAPRKVRETEDA